MHAVIYLQRSAFQIAPDLIGKLIFISLPELERLFSHVMEVKEGYWILVQLLFSKALVAWCAFCKGLQRIYSLSRSELCNRSRTFALWDFVMESLVEPSVMLADASRGRSIAGMWLPFCITTCLSHSRQLMLCPFISNCHDQACLPMPKGVHTSNIIALLSPGLHGRRTHA